MKTFFQDSYINNKVLTRLTREIKTRQLHETISELARLNEVQDKIVSSNRIDISIQYAQLMKKIKDAKQSI